MGVRSFRQAWNVFHQGGKVYRLAQDCSKPYGYEVPFQEISALSTLHYAEQEVGANFPEIETRAFGVHTFNQTHGLTVLDAKRVCTS